MQIPGKPERPRKRSRWLLANKGYDAEHLRQYCDRYRMQPVIPLRAMPRKTRPGLPRLFDRPKYRQRNIIERMFGWLKENRRMALATTSWREALQPWSRWPAACVVCGNTFRTKPRWDRNLNTGEPETQGTAMRVASQRVLHDSMPPSRIELRIIVD